MMVDIKTIKRNNINYLIYGSFFSTIAWILVSYFFPFYLMERGYSILEIGFFLTIGLAIGTIFVGIGFSKIQKAIKLRSGLLISSVLSFFYAVSVFVFPNKIGAILSEFFGKLESGVYNVASNVTFQHNSIKKDHRKNSSKSLIFDSSSHAIGIALSILLIGFIGFKWSFLLFSLLVIPSFFLYYKIKEKTRFKLKENREKSKRIVPLNLKLLIFAEIIYWFALGASFSLVITFLVTEKFGNSFHWIGYLFIILQGTIVITTLITQKYLDKINLYKTSILGMVLLLLSAIVMIISKDVYIALIAMIIEGIGAGIWVPSKTALQWKMTPKELREDVSGYFSGWRGFVNSIGPLTGALLVTYIGINAPFYLKIIISLISITIYYYIWKKIK